MGKKSKAKKTYNKINNQYQVELTDLNYKKKYYLKTKLQNKITDDFKYVLGNEIPSTKQEINDILSVLQSQYIRLNKSFSDSDLLHKVKKSIINLATIMNEYVDNSEISHLLTVYHQTQTSYPNDYLTPERNSIFSNVKNSKMFEKMLSIMKNRSFQEKYLNTIVNEMREEEKKEIEEKRLQIEVQSKMQTNFINQGLNSILENFTL